MLQTLTAEEDLAFAEPNLHVVYEAEHDPEHHLSDPHDHRHLHLVGVQESQLILGNIPDLEKED